MALSSENTSLLTFDNLQVPASQVVIVYTEWNEPIINELKKGAKTILSQFPQLKVSTHVVPGCFELPFAAKLLAQHDEVKGIIALGCVIRGETPHFDYVSKAVTDGILHLNLHLNVPVVFGVLTVNTEEQAWDRLGGKHGHKGEEAAITCLKMMDFAERNKSTFGLNNTV